MCAAGREGDALLPVHQRKEVCLGQPHLFRPPRHRLQGEAIAQAAGVMQQMSHGDRGAVVRHLRYEVTHIGIERESPRSASRPIAAVVNCFDTDAA